MVSRDKSTGKGFKQPNMVLEHSDSEFLAQTRADLAKDTITWLKENPPSDIYSQPPSETEFEMIKGLYTEEKSMTK